MTTGSIVLVLEFLRHYTRISRFPIQLDQTQYQAMVRERQLMLYISFRAPLLSVVKNDSQRVSITGMNGADAVTKPRSVVSSRAANGSMIN